MSYLEWEEKFSVNDPVMDQHHRQMFGILNNLHDSVKRGIGPEIVASTLRELDSYTKKHFKEEEAFLSSINYPKLEEHKSYHKQFSALLNQHMLEVEDGYATFVAPKLMNDCVTWLHRHILETDSEYADFILNNKLN